LRNILLIVTQWWKRFQMQRQLLPRYCFSAASSVNAPIDDAPSLNPPFILSTGHIFKWIYLAIIKLNLTFSYKFLQFYIAQIKGLRNRCCCGLWARRVK
jgi:hypothetical protein